MDAYGAPSRPGTSLARTHRAYSTDHPHSPSYPLSPLLQERLQRSRRVENERMAAQSSSDMLTSSTSSRHVGSPSPADSPRPRSSGGAEAAKPKKGLSVKEVEQTLSSLHKQNFDLKLELYHRRERQTALEERIEALEREAKERDDLNDSLLRELEKRDKAVEDAVAMILALEKRVEQLLLERKMARQVEAEGTASPHVDSPAVTPAAKKTATLEPSPLVESKTPTRLPSFVSEQSENLQHLRSVYLGAGDSNLSLPRLVGDTPDTTRTDPRLASPALSDLSESSFISIYGRERTGEVSSPSRSSVLPGNEPSRTAIPALESQSRVRSSTPRQYLRPSSSRATSGRFYNIGDVLGIDSSPLQLLEKTNITRVAAMRQSPRPTTATRDKDSSPFPRPPTSQAQPKTKKEKREALERVLTQGHFNSPQTLPPTPDTLSTTTLGQNDTPSKEQVREDERGYQPTTQATAARAPTGDEHPSSARAAPPASAAAHNSRKQFQTLNDQLSAVPDSGQSRPDAQAMNARSRDASGRGVDILGHKRRDSTTSSVDTWLRESLKPDSMDALDPMSSVSQTHASAGNGRISPDLFSFPTSAAGWAAHAMFGSLGGKGYISAGGKPPSATPIADMLDAIGASVPPSPGRGPGRFTPTLYTGPTAPPPPNRRSSLQARTGATADAAPETEGISQPSARSAPGPSAQTKGSARANRARSNSTDVRPPPRHLTELGLKQDRARTVPPKQVHLPPPVPPKQDPPPQQQDAPSQPLSKQRHYPPTASQGSRPRSRGLNSFFRRSTGSADMTHPPAPPASAPPTQTAFKPPPPHPPMGIPSWVRRSSLAAAEDDACRASATPPPILRNKATTSAAAAAAGVENDEDGGVALHGPSGAAAAAGRGGGVEGGLALGAVPGSAPAKAASSRKSWGGGSGSGEGGPENGGGGVPIGNSTGGASAGGGGKRKWLGLGRVGSLRNRGA